MIGPDAPFEDKARHLRALYRQHRPSARWRGNKLVIDQAEQALQMQLVEGEFGRLFPAGDARLDLILVDAWTEARKLAGQTYDYSRQTWVGPDGKAVDR
mgnify:CR=1 FL=1